MKTEACERYLNDPDANASHLAECAECSALFSASDATFKPIVDMDALPLAPWESASEKSWPLVIGGALAIFVIASALFAIAGVAPVNGIMHVLRSTIPSFTTLQVVLRYVGDGMQHAPASLQIVIAVSFLIVNTLLIVLLRRAPKGIDV